MAEVVPLISPSPLPKARQKPGRFSPHRRQRDNGGKSVVLNVTLPRDLYNLLGEYSLRSDRSYSGSMSTLLDYALKQSIPEDQIVLTCVLPRNAPTSVLGLLLLDLMARHPAPAYLRWTLNATGYVFTVAMPGP